MKRETQPSSAVKKSGNKEQVMKFFSVILQYYRFMSTRRNYVISTMNLETAAWRFFFVFLFSQARLRHVCHESVYFLENKFMSMDSQTAYISIFVGFLDNSCVGQVSSKYLLRCTLYIAFLFLALWHADISHAILFICGARIYVYIHERSHRLAWLHSFIRCIRTYQNAYQPVQDSETYS